MRLPPEVTLVVDPAPASVGRSSEAPGSKEPIESQADRISDLPNTILREIISLPHQGLLPHPSPLISVEPSMEHRVS
jgi:hypothetical protein